MLDILVKGGQIVTEEGIYEGNIGICGDKIAVISSKTFPLSGVREIDATGMIVMPGFIDAHVHHRTQVPGLTTVDTPSDVSKIAAYGGITTFMFYIGARWATKPDQITDAKKSVSTPEEFFTNVIEEEERSLYIDFGIHCMLFPNLDIIEQIPRVAKMGIKSFKMVLGYHPSRGWALDDSMLMLILENVASCSGLAMFHCENGYIIGYLEDKYVRNGNYNINTFLEARNNLLEAETIYRTVTMSRITGCPMYVVHLSAKEGLENIINSQLSGYDVTAETCPQYMLFNEEHIKQQGNFLKMAPPIRTAIDNEAMWNGLKNGHISVIASDHVSLGKQQKIEANDFQSVPFGIPGIETIAPLVYSEGVEKGRLSLQQMAQVLSTNPAKTFGLYPTKGTIQVGSDADIVIIDPNIKWKISTSTLHSNTGFTPYEGWEIKGKPILSLLRGKELLKDGQIHTEPGFGKFLRR